MNTNVRKNSKIGLTPEQWGLELDERGRLTVAGHVAADLAHEYGTPLHVVHEKRLGHTAREFVRLAQSRYAGNVSVHYPFKCNSVPGVVQTIRRGGLGAEVMTEFELELALRIGYRSEEIIVNGPAKSERLLKRCVDARVRLIVVDSREELVALGRIADELGTDVEVLLRINPNYVPRGMNYGSATGSRKGCAFGFDLQGGEVEPTLKLLKSMPRLRFRGYHFHIGSGIRDPRDYRKMLQCLPGLKIESRRAGLEIGILDVGGGFASPTTREFTSREMLVYQAFGNVPIWKNGDLNITISEFANVISAEIEKRFWRSELPELIYEPGRCIASPNQFLLLSVCRIKERPGVGKWLIMDGGLSTVTLPTFYEYHEVLLCNDVRRPRTERVSMIGPACFAGDVIYRNKWMPSVRSGEILAIMDTGAYFTALESSFGFPRPAIVSVGENKCTLIRSRESFEDMMLRDLDGSQQERKEVSP